MKEEGEESSEGEECLKIALTPEMIRVLMASDWPRISSERGGDIEWCVGRTVEDWWSSGKDAAIFRTSVYGVVTSIRTGVCERDDVKWNIQAYT